MKVPLLDLKAQYVKFKSQIMTEIEAVCDNQSFILGKRVADFEEQVAAYCGCNFGVGVSSGSDALLICLMAEGIGAGDEVITTPYTFFATAGAIARTNATPVFVDIDPQTYNIDPHQLQARITSKTKAIIPVHLYGQCADMGPIIKLAQEHGLVVIEDAAQAIGAEAVFEEDGHKRLFRAGSIGDYGCFSFFPSKNLGGFGDGGLVTTNAADKAEKLRVLRAHGSKPKYHHALIGGNFRLDALQAAVLGVKLRYLDDLTAARQANACWYDREFELSGLTAKGLLERPQAIWKAHLDEISAQIDFPAGAAHYHIYNQYVIATPQRDALQRHLQAKEIGTAIYYPIPLHLQDCFAYLGYRKGDFPVSESAAEKTLAIPIYPELSPEQRTYVLESIVEGLSA